MKYEGWDSRNAWLFAAIVDNNMVLHATRKRLLFENASIQDIERFVATIYKMDAERVRICNQSYFTGVGRNKLTIAELIELMEHWNVEFAHENKRALR